MEFPERPSFAINEELSKLLIGSSLASAALLALTGVNQADAAIIYQSYNQVIDSTNPASTPGQALFDLNGDGIDDLAFFYGSDTSTDDGQTDAISLVGASAGLVFSGNPTDAVATRLAQNDPINSGNIATNKGPAGVGALALNKFNTNTSSRIQLGEWYNGGNGFENGFVGFGFSDAASDIFYGWARVSIAPYTDGDLNSLAITLVDVGYESTPNTQILAGAGIPATVPEGSPAVGLVVLGLGAAGTRLLLKRSRSPQVWEKLALGASKTPES